MVLLRMKYGYVIFLFIGFVLLAADVLAQPVSRERINSGWEFYKGTIDADNVLKDQHISWEKISLPHSYNTVDVMDDTAGYYRGITWYKKKINLQPGWRNKQLFIHFEGVNQQAIVFINGKKAGEHIGGYTGFTVRADLLLNWDSDNYLLVKVDNSHNEDIPPLSGDFTFFGGIYRDVFIEAVNPVHFTRTDHGAPGIYITTPQVSAQKASVVVRGTLENVTHNKQTVWVRILLKHPSGQTIQVKDEKVSLKAASEQAFEWSLPDVNQPLLWSPDEPNMYRLVCQLRYNKDDSDVKDELVQPLGFRWFSFDPQTGFWLNGKPYKLIGTSRHQDYPMLGNALPDVLHERDVAMIKEMGANFIRIAHYPQDPAVMDACDRLGLIASVEIPIVNAITETEAFTRNSLNMQREMIRQNFNHPSVMIWAYMNEVLLRPKFGGDTARQKIYFEHVTELAQQLEHLTKQEDSTRKTMMAFHGDFNRYKKAGLLSVADIAGWNLYMGWYSAKLEGLGSFLDNFHKEFPDKIAMVTEFGADGDPRIRSFHPQRFDKSVEYTLLYHKYYFKEIMARPFVAGATVWNFADFNSEEREETMPHINNKGLVTLNRQPKDPYYYYQSKLVKEPYLKIASRGWTERGGVADSANNKICYQPVEIFTNRTSPVIVYINGKKLATKTPVDGSIILDVPFSDGKNLLAVSMNVDGLVVSDQVEIDFRLQPYQLAGSKSSFRNINISLGDFRYFTDEQTGEVWLPDQPYRTGSWGFIGGEIFKPKNQARQAFGSDKAIAGTELDAIFQTQRMGNFTYKMDLPDGTYQLNLLLTELESNTNKEALAYNLDNGKTDNSFNNTGRDFDILINQQTVTTHVGSMNTLPAFEATAFNYIVDVNDGKGITISFKTYKGAAVLSGLQVKKIF